MAPFWSPDCDYIPGQESSFLDVVHNSRAGSCQCLLELVILLIPPEFRFTFRVTIFCGWKISMTHVPYKLSVLVVDDNRDAADSMAELLEGLGYLVRAAYNGIDAQRLASESPTDVVILDLLMPGMTGWELAQRLSPRPLARRPLFIAITGCQQAADRQRSADVGIDYHLLKPVPFETIKDILERFLAATLDGPSSVGDLQDTQHGVR
jgi:CheY-like chemotaxis protein